MSSMAEKHRRTSPEPPSAEKPLFPSDSQAGDASTVGTTRRRVSSSQQRKKQKLQASYASVSPFPQFLHPTESEAREVHRILQELHRPSGFTPWTTATKQRRHSNASTPSSSTNNASATCGNVPNVEALIGTILSQNTSGRNCARAKSSLDEKFGRNNFSAMADAPQSQIVDAIRVGGLANKKAKTIQKVLVDIHKKHGEYSLQHLASDDPKDRMSDAEIMQELLSYDGVGPKTASCVLLFYLGRKSFAVDTHIFRISKMLGWVPSHADRVLAQAHLNIRIPDDIKYDLHVLMIQHGRSCRGCKAVGSGISCELRTRYCGEKDRPASDEQIP